MFVFVYIDLPDVVSVVSQNRFVSTEIGCQFAWIQPTSTTDITGYLVRLTNAHKQSELELSLSSNNNLFLDELEENTAYTVEIRGRNRHGLGPTSSIYVFQTTSCTGKWMDQYVYVLLFLLAILVCKQMRRQTWD